MHWLTKSKDFWGQCDEKSQGTSGKNRIKPEQFLRVEIPLPPLAGEQRRIVARIDELGAQIHEARTLRQQLVQDLETLCRVILSADDRVVKTPMKDLVRFRKPDVSVLPEG